MTETVSVLVCTYRRNARLALLLRDLACQTHPPDQVVVVDNDSDGGARATVADFAADAEFPVRYDIQPQKNISITRNRSIELATGDWLGFLDDDERAPPHWLEQMLATARSCGVAGVQGPVIYELPADAPAWLHRADQYGARRVSTGTPVAPNRAWINNALIRAAVVRAVPGPFDEVFGLTGGEDSDMLARLLGQGHRLVWCDAASVSEPVHPSRMSLRWLLLRAMRGGQDYATHWKRGLFGPLHWHSWPLFLLRALVQMIAALGLAALLVPAGRHRAVTWLRRAAANAGKLSALLGWRYAEYAAPPPGRARTS